MITILDPRAEAGVPITPYHASIEPMRPGLRVGLLSNTFFDATRLLEAVGRSLEALHPGLRITIYESPNSTLVSTPELIAEVARNNHMAVTALGHCGSCTSSATRDAVSLARAGTPVCALISEKFWPASAFVARSAGMPDVPRVRLPHPVAGTGPSRIGEIAAGAAPDILAAWSGRHAHVA